MGRRGRSHRFLDDWHDRHLELADGDTVHWTLIAAADTAPHATAFRITGADGTSRGLHPTEARSLLAAAGHPDANTW